MAYIREFKAIRPAEGRAAEVADLPYDVMNEKEAREMVRERPYSFLNVDRAETAFPEGSVRYNDEAVYEQAGRKLGELMEKGILFEDEEASFYIYREIQGDHVQTGIAATLRADDYLSGTIKKHELTRKDKEDDRVRHVEATGAHTGPIFVIYREDSEITSLIAEKTKEEPLYDFTDSRGVQNTVWKTTPEESEALRKAFEKIDSLYIADGHHRNAAAVRVALEKREKGASPEDESAFYLAVVIADDQIDILDYNRVISGLNGHSAEELPGLLEKDFTVTKKACMNCAKAALAKHSFAMYLNGQWYVLTYRGEEDADPVKALDVSILEDRILLPVLGIEDERTDQRIDFVGGARGYEELENRVNSGECDVAFALYPTSAADIMSVADAGRIMPPKSTWFEPKLLSGLFIHRF